jgi:hypothetical protein
LDPLVDRRSLDRTGVESRRVSVTRRSRKVLENTNVLGLFRAPNHEVLRSRIPLSNTVIPIKRGHDLNRYFGGVADLLRLVVELLVHDLVRLVRDGACDRGLRLRPATRATLPPRLGPGLLRWRRRSRSLVAWSRIPSLP